MKILINFDYFSIYFILLNQTKKKATNDNTTNAIKLKSIVYALSPLSPLSPAGGNGGVQVLNVQLSKGVKSVYGLKASE